MRPVYTQPHQSGDPEPVFERGHKHGQYNKGQPGPVCPQEVAGIQGADYQQCDAGPDPAAPFGYHDAQTGKNYGKALLYRIKSNCVQNPAGSIIGLDLQEVYHLVQDKVGYGDGKKEQQNRKLCFPQSFQAKGEQKYPGQVNRKSQGQNGRAIVRAKAGLICYSKKIQHAAKKNQPGAVNRRITRLTAVSSDNAAVNQLVNEQTEMGILIAIPGILATLTLAPWVLRAFYSEAFMPAADVIRWQILGIALRVVSWPMGFVQLGKGMSKLFMLTETVFAAVNVALLFVCMKFWGLEGVGISFMFHYILYTITMLAVCRRISGFAWTRRLLLFILAACCIISIIMLAIRNLPFQQGTLCGLVITGLTLAACCFGLQQLLDLNIKSLILKLRN